MSEGEEERIGILMYAGCASVYLPPVVSIVFTKVAMQNRRLASCVDALASAGVSGVSASTVFTEGSLGADEKTASSRVDRVLAGLSDSTCRVGNGVSVSRVSISSGEMEVGVRVYPRVSLLSPVLRSVVVPELVRTSNAYLCRVQGPP